MPIPTPVSFWNFDESSGDAADALGVNTLTNNNTATFTTGLIGNCADLELGSSQSFSRTDTASLDFSGDFSWAGWVNVESLPATEMGLISKTDSGILRSYNIAITSSGDGTTLKGFVSADGTTTNRRQSTSNAAILSAGDIGNWVHLAATFDVDTGAWVLYRNGSSVAATASDGGTVASIFNSANPFQVGASNAVGVNNNFFDGKIDMWGVWNSTLSAADITSLYNAGAGTQYPFPSSNGNFLVFM